MAIKNTTSSINRRLSLFIINNMLSLQIPSSFHSITSMPSLDHSILSNSSSRSCFSETDHHEDLVAARASRAALWSSLVPLFSFLRKSGVSRNSIDELWVLVDKEEYVTALQRATTYADCLSNSSTILSSYFLLLGCWNSLCRLSSLQYTSAFKRYHKMRHYSNPQNSHTTEWPYTFVTTTLTNSIEAALQAVNDAGERCCACQRELILSRKKERIVARALRP